MRLFSMSPARRFVSLAILLFFAVPFGLSVTGCKHALAVQYCNGGDSGPVVGQIATITLSPTLAVYGESLNYGQIGQSLSASAQDCKGNSVSASSYTYASTDGYIAGSASATYADINPSTGQVCAGTWNRHTGGGVADYTTCTAPPSTPPNYLAYVTATANGAVSNAIPVFIHPAATSTSIGTPSGSCLVGTDMVTVTTNGVTATGSSSVTVSDTTGIGTGEPVSALGIPAGTTIAAVNPFTNTLTLSSNATETTPTFTGSTTTGSPTVTVSSTTGIVTGQNITGTGIPANTTITAVTAATNTLTLSNNATATTPTGQPEALATNVKLTVTITGSTIAGSPVVAMSSTNGVATGEGITGPGIPATTSITAVTVNTLTLSNNATATAQNIPITIIGNPTSNCCPLTYTAPTAAPTYTGTSCLSQGATAQLVASVFDNGSTYAADNITCQVGHLNFAAVGATNVVTIDENGVATANQPGSATITASISNSGSGSTAGFFSTCPPTNISLTSNGSIGPIAIGLNNSQPFTAVVTDKNGTTINGLSLEYESTFPQTIPASGNTVQPTFPGTATITAVCQPGTCNPSPYSQIDYQGNGTALTSNGIVVNAAGTSSTVLYIGSTSSQYLYPVDFTTNQPATLLKLPYVPNSMVINQSGTDIYLGSSSALMTVSATNNTLASTNTNIVGQVLSVSPDGTTLVTTDSAKNTVTLVNTSGSVTASYGGVATRASWSPDSQTVYITTTTGLLVHNAFTSWTAIPLTTAYTDVTVTVPHIGAYFAGPLLDGRSYCPSNTLTAGTPPTTTNSFYPIADEKAIVNERIVATNDGAHILGAAPSAPTAALNDLAVTLPVQTACPVAPATIATNYFQSSNTVHPLTGVTATDITGVYPSSNSAAAFVTYTGSSANPLGALPVYFPATGTLSAVKLSGTATAPVSGVWSDDNLTFYTGTSGDGKVHEISVTYPSSGLPTATDSGTISPALPDANGNTVTPNLLVQRPKKSTN